MSRQNWHDFQETGDGDDRCGSCGVVVAGAMVHLTFTLPCPVAACPARANPDGMCVFTCGRDDEAVCIYCRRPGEREPLPSNAAADRDGRHDTAVAAYIDDLLDLDHDDDTDL